MDRGTAEWLIALVFAFLLWWFPREAVVARGRRVGNASLRIALTLVRVVLTLATSLTIDRSIALNAFAAPASGSPLSKKIA